MEEPGSLLGPAALRQIMQLIRAENARVRNPDAGHRAKSPINESESLQGFLTTDLAPATDPATGATTATLRVYYRDPVTEDLLDAGRTVTVTNRYTDFSRASGDYLVVFWIEQEWRPHLVIRTPSHALAKLSGNMCPDDECVAIECVTGECDAPATACNLFRLSGQAGDYVYLAKIAPCESDCDDPYACKIDLCESTVDYYGDSSCGAAADPCEAKWVIVQVRHKVFCPLIDTDLRTPEGAYGLDEGKYLLQARASISAMYCAEDAIGEIVGNVCCEESEEESGCLPQVNLEFDFSEAANCDEGPNVECCSEEREDEPLPDKLYVTATITNFILGTQVSSQSFEIDYNRTLRKWSGSPTICGTTWEIHLWLADSPEEYVCEMVPDPFQGVGEANCFALQSFCSSYDDAINAIVVPDSDSTCSPLVLTFVHAIATCAGCENSDQLTITFTIMEIES